MLSRAIGSSRHLALTIFQRFGLVPFRDVLPPHVFGAAAADADCAPPGGRASCTPGEKAGETPAPPNLGGVHLARLGAMPSSAWACFPRRRRAHPSLRADESMAPNATSPRKPLT